MLLAIGVDNARITCGVYREQALCATFALHSDTKKTPDEYAYLLGGMLHARGIAPETLHHAMIASVVAPLTDVIAQAVGTLCGITPALVGPGIKTGLNIKIDDPAQLGSDIVALTVGALSKYEAPLILVDLGVVTTMSVVDAARAFCGTIIMPGVASALEELSHTAGSLPMVSIAPPRTLIGTNTADSMRSGAINGMCAMIDGLIDRIGEEIPGVPRVVATGDFAACIAPRCAHSITRDDTLLLDGLCHLHHKNAPHPKTGR